jgi:hypothetical protein
MIPDKDLPWSQNERDNSFGNQEEMSTFGLPQKNSMMKARHHGSSKYSPIVSGAPYSTPGKITEWNGSGSTSSTKDGSNGGDDGFNQKDHYGHKDPLGNLYHVDMKSKTLNIDWTKLSEVIINHPKITFNSQDTKWNRNRGTQEDGSPSQIQGMSSSRNGAGKGVGKGVRVSTLASDDPDNVGPTVAGDVTWNVSGQHTSTVQKAVTETFKSTQTTNVQDVHTVNDGNDHIHNIGSSGLSSNGGGSYTRKVAQSTTVSGGQSRSDTYGNSWSSSAQNTAWSWLTSRSTMGG